MNTRMKGIRDYPYETVIIRGPEILKKSQLRQELWHVRVMMGENRNQLF